MSTFDTFL